MGFLCKLGGRRDGAVIFIRKSQNELQEGRSSARTGQQLLASLEAGEMVLYGSAIGHKTRFQEDALVRLQAGSCLQAWRQAHRCGRSG